MGGRTLGWGAAAVAGLGVSILIAAGVAPAVQAATKAAGKANYRPGLAVDADCHGADAKISAVGPDLTSGAWLWGDGSLASISDIIAKGVAPSKTYRSPMPAMGGAQLSAQELADVSAYVWAVGHKGP